MPLISFIKIKNFKIFGEEITINFDDTTVLIGPNNAGKTTAIQALVLWQLGIKTFFDAKTELDKDGKRKIRGKLDTTAGIGINRLDMQIPTTDTRQLFNKGRIRTGRENEKIQLTVGISHNDKVTECGVTFKYFKSEVIYCYLGESCAADVTLLEKAAHIQLALLYPMSGLEREETVLQEGAIQKRIGLGITAGLLRNVCYNLFINNPQNWNELTAWMKKLFYIELETPKRSAYADLQVRYNYSNASIKAETSLDILQAGRGQLQILLILAFNLLHKNSIILIDEPDAHLEVLRQSQIMEILKYLADKYQNQIIIASHSEVVMNDAEDLTFLLNGRNIHIGESKKKILKNSLKDFGIEHYYKAELTKAVLYLEGVSDKQNLQAIAEHLHHKAAGLLSDKIFVYYTKSPDAEHNDFEMTAGYYSSHKKHFQALAPVVTELKGIAVFDNDDQNRKNEDGADGLKTRFWKQYELENYFLTPESILAFMIDYFVKKDGAMFAPIRQQKFEILLDSYFLSAIFENPILLNLYKTNTNPAEKTALYDNNSRNKKISSLLEATFQKFVENGNELILKKNEFYKIIPFCVLEQINSEVSEKLDEIYDTMKNDSVVFS